MISEEIKGSQADKVCAIAVCFWPVPGMKTSIMWFILSPSSFRWSLVFTWKLPLLRTDCKGCMVGFV